MEGSFIEASDFLLQCNQNFFLDVITQLDIDFVEYISLALLSFLNLLAEESYIVLE
jgi:hypothetical protein